MSAKKSDATLVIIVSLGRPYKDGPVRSPLRIVEKRSDESTPNTFVPSRLLDEDLSNPRCALAWIMRVGDQVPVAELMMARQHADRQAPVSC
jgi:hypothetical protein